MATTRPGRRIGKWILAAVAILVFTAALLIDGYVRSGLGTEELGTPTRGPINEVPKSVIGGGPIVDPRSEQVHSIVPRERTVALIFDYGPDPRWTPQVLEVLRRHRVPATFFVVGSQAVQHPRLLRDIRSAGGEIGIQTFSEPELAAASVRARSSGR